MPRSTRRRSRKHDREERDRSDSDEDPRPREQEDRKAAAVRASKGSEDREKRPAKLPNAGEASGSSAEGHRKRKSRGEKETAAGDDRRSCGEEDERVSYYDSKKSRNSDGDDVKGKSARKSSKEYDRSNEVGRRKSDKETLSEGHSIGEHHRVKERGRELEAEKSKESSKQVLMLKEDGMDQQYKVVKDRSKDHEKVSEGGHDASSKATSRNKEVKTRDLDSDKTKNYSNGGTDGRHREDELHDGESEKNGRHRKTKDQSVAKDESQSGSKLRQTMPRDGLTKTDGCYEQQHTYEKLKDDMPRGVEKHKEEKYRDDKSKAQDRHKSNKHKDDRHKDEELHRDERYREERSRHEDRHRDVKYRGERSKEEDRYKDERYKDKPRDEEKPRNERSDNSSREKHGDDIYRYHRSQDGGSWDVRSSKDKTRDRSLEKHCKEEHHYSESRHNKNRFHDNEVDTSAADRRSSKYRDDSKAGKKRSYEESIHNGDLEPRNAKEYHGDAKRRSDVGSFVSSEDRRREYEKVDSRRRDFERKSPTRSSTYPVKEQSRHFPKQEESSPRENGAALGRHGRAYDFQSVEGLSKTDANSNESSLPLKDGKSLRSDGRSIHFNDRPPSASDCQVSNRSNLRHNHDAVDGSVKKGNTRHHELNRQATEKNYQSASPGHLHLPRDRPEMDNQRSFDDDNRSQIRERRSSSRSRRSGTVDNARGHGNTWNNPSSWPSPVPNGFGPFQHGPPIPGFHPAIHQFPQSLFGMRPSMDTNHAGMHYPLHGHPESFPHCAQPFPWHNPAEDPYLSRVPGWDANRSVFEEYSHGYGRQELVRNNDPDFQQQSESEVPLSSHTSDKPSLMQLPAQNESQSSEVKRVGTNAEKTDAHAPKYRSEATPGLSNVKVDSRFCSNYFKRLDISTRLASPELYKKCSTMVGELELAGWCESNMHRCLKNNKDEHAHQAQGFKCIKSIFSGKATSVFENAMKLYSSSTVSSKSKALASSSEPESEEMMKEASVDMVAGKNVAVGDDQALPCTDMCDEVHNNNQPHHAVVSSMPAKAGLAKDCSKTGEDKVGSDVEDNHAEGLQVPSNGEGELLLPKALQPCCSSVGSTRDVLKEQFSGVISDATFASGSQSCEDVMPGCRVNLSRIPCSPGST